MSEPTFTKHAERRWNQRFPHLDKMEEWSDAYRARRRIGRSFRLQLKKLCPIARSRGVISKTFNGYYYKMSKNRIVFVVAPPRIIITVFQLP